MEEVCKRFERGSEEVLKRFVEVRKRFVEVCKGRDRKRQ